MAQFILNTINVFLLLLAINLSSSDDEACVLRPLGTRTEPLPPDNRFKIDVVGLADKYIPMRQYKVRLYATDNTSTFIAFTITAQEDTKPNEKNPRKPIRLSPGRILPIPYDSVPSPYCNNSVIQVDITPKTAVTANWRAPPKDNKCVTIHAMLAVMQDVWYSYEGPLSKQVCEDIRKAEDMQPTENDDCDVCEDARYLLTFERLWTYNTHPQMFPTSDLARDMARFSDVVGASHSKNFYLFGLGSVAGEGLMILAAQGNTTKLEMETREKLGSSVRTIIKASSEASPNMVTTSIFRATREHHLVSLVTAIIPSPDWFLGVANMELCEIITNKWATNLSLNLYPLDAGTDSGLTFESPNEETLPAQPISSASINKFIPKEQTRPFARIRFDLMRTYSTPNCVTETPVTNEETEEEIDSSEPQPTTPPPKETPAPRDPDSTAECPMTEWEEWLPCEGPCIDGHLTGYHTRFRYHLVDNVPVRKYDEHGSAYDHKDAPQYCLDNYEDNDVEECEEPCQEEATDDVTAESRIWRRSVSPGNGWSPKLKSRTSPFLSP